MNSYAMHKPTSPNWTKAFLISIGVHLLLVVLWIIAVLVELIAFGTQEFVKEIIPEESYVTVPVELVEAFENRDPVLEEPAPPKKQFLSTQASQETSEPVTSDRYFGERNTAAASEGEIADEGLAVPSQEGREARTENDVEVANSNFSDGEDPGAPGQPGQPLPVSQALDPVAEATPLEKLVETKPTEASEPTEIAEVIESTPLVEPTESTEPEEVADPIDELPTELAEFETIKELALANSIEVPKPEEIDEPAEEPVVEEAIPAPKPEPLPEPVSKPQPRAVANAANGNQGFNGGFNREANRTRLSGTIRRRGESSLEVEDSVKGRYFAKVNKEIEKAWQRECILRREHILPGVLSVSFVMDNNGKVTGFRFDSRIAGGAIQEGFTMRAIQKAKIPSMPEEIQQNLNGNDLEMNITFFF